MGSFGKDLTGLAMALIAVAVAAMVINRSSDAAAIIKSTGTGFNSLLKTVSLQT